MLDDLAIVKTDMLREDLSGRNTIYRIPESIRKHIACKTYHMDNVGCSDSQVRIYDDLVLKIEEERSELADMVSLMKWLEEKLPVPKVIYTEVSGGYRVENDMVDVDDAEPETYGEGEFKDPYELLSWLETNRPEEELVFSHGDLCLPNIFFQDGKLSGLIDIGNAGVCDKWQDLALCYRSLKHNANGSYAKVYPGINEDELFKLLGIEPDNEKLRYYILLDELF